VASNTTSDVSVPLDRTAAIRDPSGDHVGNPKLPSASPDKAADRPPASMIDNEASWLRTAIDPDAAIGRSATIEVVGSAAGLDVAIALGVADAGVASGVEDGVGPPHAATRRAVAAQVRTSLRTRTIPATIRATRPGGSRTPATGNLSGGAVTIGAVRPSDRPRQDAMAQLRVAEQAWAASRRMIARGERPGYHVAETGDGETIHVVELPWLGRIAVDRPSAIRKARQAIAEWLGVDLEAFDIEGA
jgi:hypothetical protein